MIQVLQPFKVTDSDTTSVTKHIWQELNTLGKKDLFSFHGGWSIGCLNNQLALKPVSVIGVDGFFNSSWNEKVAKLQKKYQALYMADSSSKVCGDS
jgi:hypothetical protein